MHAVVRTYSGQGASALFDLLEQRKTEVEGVIRGVSGFQAYTLIRTADGGITVTVCQDKAGTDESLQLARDWIQQNAPDLGAAPPAVTEGSVVLQLG
jgi:restriction endonuclease Mrr